MTTNTEPVAVTDADDQRLLKQLGDLQTWCALMSQKDSGGAAAADLIQATRVHVIAKRLAAEAAQAQELEALRAKNEALRGQVEYLLRLFPSGIFNEQYAAQNDVIRFLLHTKEAATVRNIRDALTGEKP